MRATAVIGLSRQTHEYGETGRGGCSGHGKDGRLRTHLPNTTPTPPHTLHGCRRPRLGNRRSPPRGTSPYKENWLALKSQIREVAKIVAAVPTFRIQRSGGFLWAEAPQLRTPRPAGRGASALGRRVGLLQGSNPQGATLPPTFLLFSVPSPTGHPPEGAHRPAADPGPRSSAVRDCGGRPRRRPSRGARQGAVSPPAPH